MAIYYIEDPNGKFKSADGKRRFSRLEGNEAYQFLRSELGNKKRFMRANDEEENESIFVEVQPCHVSCVRKDERRKQYVADCKEQSGFKVISLYATDTEDDSDRATGEELIADEFEDVEEYALHNMELERLRMALTTLTKEEMSLINALYLCKEPVTERELSRRTGVPQKTINCRKKSVLAKLKNFF